MIALLIYLIGVLILFIGTFIYKYHEKIQKYKSSTIKLLIYQSFKFSLLSWIAIIVLFAIMITVIIDNIDEWLTIKLNS